MGNSKKSQKQLQVGEQVKRIIADIFLQDNNLQFRDIHITIIEADVSPDMKNAKIFINIFGKISDNNKTRLVGELNKFSPYLRKQLIKKLTIRTTPELRFVLDNTMENAGKISSLIEEESKKFKSEE